jgi:hypothetical protein
MSASQRIVYAHGCNCTSDSWRSEITPTMTTVGGKGRKTHCDMWRGFGHAAMSWGPVHTTLWWPDKCVQKWGRTFKKTKVRRQTLWPLNLKRLLSFNTAFTSICSRSASNMNHFHVFMLGFRDEWMENKWTRWFCLASFTRKKSST